LTSKRKEYTLTKWGWIFVAAPLLVFLFVIIRNNYFFPFYNYNSLWIVMGKISIMLIIAYVLTRTEGTKFENLVGFMVIFAFIPVFIIIFFKLSYGYLIPWIAGIVMNYLVLIGYNGWFCSHDWTYLSELYRFCTKCHRLEEDISYMSYGNYVFNNPLDIKKLKKQYRKRHSVFPFIFSLFFIESTFYFLIIKL